MPSPHFLAISLGANHLCSAHLKMSPSGRCELKDFQVDSVEFSSHDPLLWLKACSAHLDAVAMKFKGDYPAGFVIPGHVALTKYLKIPQVAPSKRQKIVAFEARQNIPYPISEVTWDYALVEEDDLDFDVMIGTARTEIVEAVSRYSKDSEIDLRRIEPSVTSLVNAFRYNYSDTDQCCLIVSVGAKSSEMVYVDKTRFHSRNVPFGGQTISLEIAESLGVSVTDGERIKLSAARGEPLPTEEYAAFDAARRGFANRLVTEVVRTNAVLKRQGFAFEASRCYFTGGGSQLPDLATVLESRLKLPTEAINPIRALNVSDESIRESVEQSLPYLADVIGIGVGHYMPDAASVDLTPRSLVWQRKFRRQQPFYLLAGLVACGAVGLPVLNTTLEIRAYEQELQNLDVQIKPLRDLNQEIFSRTEQIKKVKDVIEKASTIAEARPTWLEVLEDLQSRLLEVEDVWLDKLRLERPTGPQPRGRGQPRVQQSNTQTKIMLEGRLIDVYNPVSSVSPDSYERVKALLERFRDAEFVASLEDERFDYSVPGILRFDFTLVVKPEVKL